MLNFNRLLFILLTLCVILFSAAPSEASEVIILADTHLKPVKEVVDSIEKGLSYSAKVYTHSHIEGRLKTIVNDENARVVIALGKEAVGIASSLPESISVIYGMLILPPVTSRQNITGVYMETPIDEYVALVNKYFTGIKRIGVVYGHETERFIKSVESPQVRSVKAKNSYEFVNAVGSLNADALLLLPDKQLLSPTAVESVYLFSFRHKVPILGISEKYVKEGSLFSLVFDTVSMGSQLAEMTKTVLAEGDAYNVAQASPRKFNLYINTDTAKKMNIRISDEVFKQAKRIYP